MKCTLYFGKDPCPNDLATYGMCETHASRWRKGDRGKRLNRRRLGDHRDPLESLKAICRAQADPIIAQEKMLNDAALIVSFASMSE